MVAGAMLTLCARPSEALRTDAKLIQEHFGIFSEAADGRIPIWLWWNYSAEAGKPMPGYVGAAQLTLEHLAPDSEYIIRKVNESNVRTFLPDWPEQMTRVYPQAVSDVVRAGLLGKYGGVYLDSDMLLAAPMSEITNQLDTHDMVAYQVPGQDCTQGSFSSNFMASRPNSELHLKWYAQIQQELQNTCSADPKKLEKQNACCYGPEGRPLPECHVSWGGLGEKIGHQQLRALLQTNEEKAKNNTDYKVFCYSFAKHESFAPCIDCFWSSIPGGQELLKDKSCSVEKVDNSSIVCQDGPKVNFFNRKAYHLFSSIAPPNVWHKTVDELKNGPWVFSHLLKRILEKQV